MNKTDLINAISKKTGLKKKDAEAALAAALEAITDTMKKGEKVQLIGFGTFEAKKRNARTAVNPRTKETVKVPASKAPSFKAGKALKDALN